jgi:uncharacterized RDD family membrane protein YckC
VAEVVTGEAVILDVPIATFPSRLLALLIDMGIQIALDVVILVIVLPRAGHVDAATMSAVLLTCWILIIVGYPTIFETLTRGKTPGKMALGQRVVSDDGSPERFRQALLRALAGVLEIWTIVLTPVALVTCIFSAKGKRLGDLWAGTFAIQERMPPRPPMPPAFAVVPPPLLGWAQSLELSRLSDQTAGAASSYLRRFAELRPAARDELGRSLAESVAAQVSPPPPPGTPPAAYLAAVLAVRRERENARLAAQRLAPPGAGVSAGAVGADPADPAAPGYGTAYDAEAGGPASGDSPIGTGSSAGGAARPEHRDAGGFAPPA